MAGLQPCNPLRYIIKRQYEDRLHINKQDELIRERLNVARNLYKKDLLAHYGCVNAIEFSNRGEFLASGGDDRRVLIWNVERAIHGVGQPVAMQAQHMSNIFCLGFDSTLSKVFSGGNDDQVIVHDTHRGTPLDNFLHEQPVYGISIDPLNDNVFASACDDGRILIYDIREPPSTEPFCLAQYSSAFHAVMFNPVEPRIVTTANSKEGVGLWDVRTPKKIVVHFGGANSFQSCMSVRFNSAGTKILALRRRLPPVIYVPDSPTHLCQFDHAGYYNSCTMKSCSFAGDKDQYILSGSDNFNLYMWKVPTSDDLGQWIGAAHMVLEGHRSIVNQVRYEPIKGIVASSGVEKIIKLWSPFTLPHGSGSLYRGIDDRTDERKVYSHQEYIDLVLRSGEFMSHDYTSRSTKEDPRMMAFFDSLVQREIEGWTSEDGSSDESVVGQESGVVEEILTPQTPETTYSPSRGSELQAIAEAYVAALETVSTAGPSEPNRISQLIARKRAQLMRLAQPNASVATSADLVEETGADNNLPSYSQAGNSSSGTSGHNGAKKFMTISNIKSARKRRRVLSLYENDSDSSSENLVNSTKVQKYCEKSEISSSSSSSSSSSENEESAANNLRKVYGKKLPVFKSNEFVFTSSDEENTVSVEKIETNIKTSHVEDKLSRKWDGASDQSEPEMAVVSTSSLKQSSTKSSRKKTKRRDISSTMKTSDSRVDAAYSSSDESCHVKKSTESNIPNSRNEGASKNTISVHGDCSRNTKITQFYDSCSNSSTGSDDAFCDKTSLSTPKSKVRNGANSTPDSGIAMGPCSSTSKVPFLRSGDVKKELFSYDHDDINGSCSKSTGKSARKEDESLRDPDSENDWQTFKRHKNGSQGKYRNYRKKMHITDSDSN